MGARGNAAIKIAAELLDLPFSPFGDDWPKSTPRNLLRRFEEQGDRLREIAWRVRYIGNCLAELDRDAARKNAEIAALRARVARLEGALRFCADDLEAEVEDRYRGTKDHPAMTHKYERDLEPVTVARALLEKPNGK